MSSLQRLIGAGLALSVAGITPAVAADPLADFYKGKRMKMIIGSGPGGGYDTYARLVSTHLGQYIPGKPSITPQNKNGAGSIIAVNYSVNALKREASTVLIGLQRNVALVQIMGKPGPRFVAKDLNWIGSLATEIGVCAVTKRSGIKKFSDLFTKSVMMAGFGPNDSEIQPALFNNTLGTKFKIIAGYPGSPPAHLAVQRGEADGMCQSWSSFKELAGAYYRDGNMIPILQMGLSQHPELKKLGVPMVFDFIKPEHVQGGLKVQEVNDLFRLLFAAKEMGRPFAMPPNVPKERVEAIRTAFNKMAKDKKFLADAKKQRRVVDLVTGKRIQDIVTKMSAAPKSLLVKLDDLQKYRGVKEKAKITYVKFTSKVTDIKRGGRRIFFKYKGKKVRASVSGSRTKVMVNGAKAKRKAIKVGMTCTVSYPDTGKPPKKVNAKSMDCK